MYMYLCQLTELRMQHTEMESLLHCQLGTAEDRSGQLENQCDQLRQSAEQLCRKLEAREREKEDLEISLTSLKEEVVYSKCCTSLMSIQWYKHRIFPHVHINVHIHVLLQHNVLYACTSIITLHCGAL